ncbi:MAG TPA: DedA family protein [Pseudonocardia sp.]|nr:DedA family protein [Pseudonocardia sp.]
MTPTTNLVTQLLDWLQSLPPAGVTAAAGLLVFCETALGLGYLAPGETGLLVLGTIADDLPTFLVMWLVTTVGAIAGDTVGYAIGRRYGPRLRRTRVAARYGAHGWDRATGLLHRYGAFAVFIAIFLPVVRTLVPAAAGAARLPLRRFLPAVVPAATAWCALHIGIGAAAGEAARQVEKAVGVGSWVLLATAVAVGVGVAVVRRRRRAVDPAPPA